jgi:hypothetical protein
MAVAGYSCPCCICCYYGLGKSLVQVLFWAVMLCLWAQSHPQTIEIFSLPILKASFNNLWKKKSALSGMWQNVDQNHDIKIADMFRKCSIFQIYWNNYNKSKPDSGGYSIRVGLLPFSAEPFVSSSAVLRHKN